MKMGNEELNLWTHCDKALTGNPIVLMIDQEKLLYGTPFNFSAAASIHSWRIVGNSKVFDSEIVLWSIGHSNEGICIFFSLDFSM